MWMFKLAGILLGILFPIVTAAETVTITSPSPTAGQIITNGCIQVFAVAQSDVGAKITAWRIYIDNIASPFRAPNTARINTRICVPSVSIGGHSVEIRAWSANQVFGDSPVVNVTISRDYKIVAPANEPLSPATGQSFDNGLIRVATSVYSPYPLTKWIVYIDGEIAFTSYEGAVQVETDLEVPVGIHDVIVKVWDVHKAIARYSASNVVVTKDVMIVPPFVQPPSDAITLRNLDNEGALEGAVKWHGPFTGASASCRATDLICAAMAPVAVAKPVQFVPTPAPLPVASDGMVALFQTLPGTEPFGNAGYATAIFDNDPSKVNYVSDMWVRLTSTNIQTLELDLSATVNGTQFMMGTQCDFASGHWDFWDDTPAVLPAHPHWRGVFPTPQNNDLVCNLKPNEWVHLRFNMFHDATSFQFVSLEIDGVNHSLTELAPSLTSRKSKDEGTAVQVQLDSNNSATPFQVYIDNFNITTW
jgi:hypothetical protein